MTSWRRHGGIYNMDNNNNVSVYSLVADVFTLRQSYYGTFDISGEISVSGNAKIGLNLKTQSLTVLTDISANRLYVTNQTYHSDDVDISGNLNVSSGNLNVLTNVNVQGAIHVQNQLYLGNTNNAFLFGTNTLGNIGINTTTPIAAFDISSSQPLAFNVGTSSLEQMSSIPIQNRNNRGIVLTANTTTSQIRFFNDSSINTGIVNGTIDYSSGGILTLDVSDNTNILSKLSVSNRGNAVTTHVMGETAVIYDTSTGTYLPQIYQNSTETTGSALSLIANDSSSNTFMNIITPGKKGLSIGGGVYPNDQKRAMGTIGWRDANANYTPSINVVAGNSFVRQKTTVGINTHSPSVDNYAFDINGPIRVRNGELTITSQSNIEILSLAVGKTVSRNAIAVGTPYTNTDGEYKHKILYTNNAGETWTENFDLSGDSIENRRVNLNTAHVYDSSLSIIGGDYGYIYYTYNGYVYDTSVPSQNELAWQTISTRFNNSPNAAIYSIKSIYVGLSKQAFFGIDTLGGVSFLHWFTMLDVNNGFSSIGIDTSLNLPDSGIKSMDGFNNTLWVSVGTKILRFNTNDPTSYTDSGLTGNYNSISVLDANNIIAAGNGIISFSMDGGANWTTKTDGVPAINQIRLIDLSNAIAVCNSGIVYASSNWSNVTSWRILSTEELNASGNANRLTDSSKNLKTLGIVNSNNFYITKTIQSYSSSLLGNTSLFHAYLPNLFNNPTNFVLDISGSVRTSGDMNINDGGKLKSNNSTFYMLNNGVSKIYFGGDASNVYIGNLQDSTVVVNANLNVLRDSLLNGNLNVTGTSNLTANLNVTGNVNIQSNLNVTGNVNIQSNLDVTGNVNIQSNLNVSGNVNIQSNLNVTGNVNIQSNLDVTGNVNIQSNLNVSGNVNIQSNLYVSGNTVVSQFLEVNSDASFNNDVYVNRRLRSSILESNSGVIQQGPTTAGLNAYDIYIGGSDIADVSNRTIRIGNFNNAPYTKNSIYLGGTKDDVYVLGNITQVKNVKVGQILYVNSGFLNAAGAGFHFGDDNNDLDSGYLVISSERTGYVFKSTQGDNRVKLDLSNLVIPSTYGSGLVSIYRAEDGTDSDYNISTFGIDPSNIILGNTNYSQEIYANLALKENLTVNGNTFLANLVVNANADIFGNANIAGTLTVTGNTFLSNLAVNANANIFGNANIGGTLTVNGNTFLSNLVVNANANIFGNANIYGTLTVTGNTFLSNLTVNSALSVLGNIFYSNVFLNQSTNITGNTVLTYPLYSAYNITNTNATSLSITLPDISNGQFIPGAIINFFKSGNLSTHVQISSISDKFVTNGEVERKDSFAIPGGTTSASLISAFDNSNNYWTGVGGGGGNAAGNAIIGGAFSVTGNTMLSNLLVRANANINGFLSVNGNTFLSNLVVNANANIFGNANIGGTLSVNGNTFLSNLVVNANANIFGNANIGGTLTVTGNTFLSNLVVNANANIFGNANIGGTLTVTGNTFLSNLVVNANANIFGNANIGGTLTVTGNTFLSNLVVNANANIFGNANIGGTLTVTGNTFLSNLVVNANANIFGNANIGGTLTVTGNTFLSNLVVNANANIFGNANIGGTLTVTGNTFLSNLVVNANANIFGNANIGGTLTVTGNTFLSNLVVNANANIFGNANIGGTLTVTGNTFLSNLVVNANANIFGNANIGGTLTVTGNTFLSNLVVNANANIFGNANIGGTLTVTGNTFLSNLVVNANANIFGNANIGGTLTVTGNTFLSNLVVNANANIFGNANIGGTLTVTGNTFLSNLVVNANANIFGNANIGGTLTVTGNTFLSNLVVNANANIFGNANIGGTLTVTGNTFLSNLVVNANANIFGNANIGGTLTVTGNTFLSNLVVNANANIFGNANIGGTLTVTGNTFLSNLVVNANANIFGNANIGGTLTVTGNTFLSNLVVNANANIFGNANIGGTLTVTGNTFLSNLVVNANANIFGNANIGGTLTVTGNTFLSNLVVNANANIFGNANIGGTLTVTGNTFLSNLVVNANANIFGNANIGGTLTVTGNTFLSNLVVNANANIFGNANIGGTLTVTGNTFLSNLVVNANANIFGNANIAGTLTVIRNTILSNTFITKGNIITFSDSNIVLDATNSVTDNVRFATAPTGTISGVENTSMGFNSLTAITSGQYNTAIGSKTLSSTTTGSENTSIGYNTLTTLTSGNFNTAVGSRALFASTGSENTSIGYNTLTTPTSGNYNTAVGSRALFASTGSENTSIGYNTLTALTSGNYNTAIGSRALVTTSTGGLNTAIGYNALTAATTGTENTSVGVNALPAVTSGTQNTAIGSSAGLLVTGASKNTFLGYSTLMVGGQFNNGTAIGANSIIRASNHIAIGTASESITIATNEAPVDGYKLTVGGSIRAATYNATSDRRLKSNIQILPNQSKTILDVIPVTFDWKVDGKHDVGFIAQDVYKAYPELLPKHLSDPSINVDEPVDPSGNPIYHAMDYGRMTPFLWQGMREILQRLDALESENRELKLRVGQLEARV